MLQVLYCFVVENCDYVHVVKHILPNCERTEILTFGWL